MKQQTWTRLLFSLFIVLVTALSLSTAAYGATQTNLLDAVKGKVIKVEIKGDGLTSVQLKITKLSKTPVKIIIPAGTLFANSGDAQDMIVTGDTLVDFSGVTNKSVKVKAACANFGKDIPESSSRFTIKTADTRLSQLVRTFNSKKPSQTIAQIAVWIITDDISRYQLDRRYVLRNSLSGFIRPVATDEDVIHAMKIVEEAKIKKGDLYIFKEKVSALRAIKYNKLPVIRNYALKCLNTKLTNNLDIYISCLKDEEYNARSEAAAQIGELKDKRGVPPLIAALKEAISYTENAVEHMGLSDDENLIIDLCRGLAELKDERANDVMIEALGVIPDDYVHHIGGAMAVMKNPKLTARLLSIVHGKSAGSTYGAIKALGEIGDPIAVKPLVNFFTSSYSDTREAAAGAVENIVRSSKGKQLYAAIEPSIKLLRSDNSTLRNNAQNILSMITNLEYGEDTAKWENWWKKNKVKFSN